MALTRPNLHARTEEIRAEGRLPKPKHLNMQPLICFLPQAKYSSRYIVKAASPKKMVIVISLKIYYIVNSLREKCLTAHFVACKIRGERPVNINCTPSKQIDTIYRGKSLKWKLKYIFVKILCKKGVTCPHLVSNIIGEAWPQHTAVVDNADPWSAKRCSPTILLIEYNEYNSQVRKTWMGGLISDIYVTNVTILTLEIVCVDALLFRSAVWDESVTGNTRLKLKFLESLLA